MQGLMRAKSTANTVDGGNAFLEAARNKQFEQMKKTYDKKYLEVADENGYTALCWVTKHGMREAVEWLIAHGANTKHKSKNLETIYHLAANWDYAELLELFVSKKCTDVYAQMEEQDIEGQRPVHSAAKGGSFNALTTLLKYEVQIDCVDKVGYTALSLAAWVGNANRVEIIKALQVKGANLEHRNCHGDTPACLAAARGNIDVLTFLQTQNSNLDHRNDGGNSPLAVASIWGHEDAVRFLLKQNIEKNPVNHFGFSAVELAELNNCRNVVVLFEKIGIKADANKITQAKKVLEELYAKGVREFGSGNLAVAFTCFKEIHFNVLRIHKDVTAMLQEIREKLPNNKSMQPKQFLTTQLGANAEDLQGDIGRAIGDLVEHKYDGAAISMLRHAEETLQKITNSQQPSKATEPKNELLVNNYGVVSVRIAIPHDQLKEVRCIGRGAFGEVWSGTYMSQKVAIKKLNNIELKENVLQAFRSEATIMASLNCKFIVNLYGICLEPRHYAMVMDYLPGGDLSGLIHEKGGVVKDVSWRVRLRIAYDLARGLCYLHEVANVVHADMKSPNILLTKTYHARITDFGISKVKGAAGILPPHLIPREELAKTLMGPSYGGSPYWMAPELFNDSKTSKEADIYAVGLIFNEMGTRQMPFKELKMGGLIGAVSRGERPAISADTPPRFASLIKFCWAQNPEERPGIAKIVDQVKSIKDEIKHTEVKPK